MRLHNFIVDYREKHGQNTRDHLQQERMELDIASDVFMSKDPFESLGVMEEDITTNVGEGGNGEGFVGRPRHDVLRERNRGRVLIYRLRDELFDNGYSRPRNKRVLGQFDRHNRMVINDEEQE